MTAPLVFAVGAYARFAEELCVRGGFEPGVLETRRFPDGERYLRIATRPEGRHVVLVGGTPDDAHVLDLFDAGCGLVEGGAQSLSIVIPFFGYQTMERATKAGEVVTAKTRARILSAIPPARFGNRAFLVDLHTEGLPYYFEGALRATHVYAKPVVMELARRLAGEDIVIACTDAGRAKWVESLANDLGVTASFVFKRRVDDDETEVLAVSANVQGRKVVVYDDMIRTGSSLVGAAKAYRAAGATGIVAIATHGVFPGEALTRLRQTGLFDAIACTDTHPRARELEGQGLVVASVAGLVAEHVQAESHF